MHSKAMLSTVRAPAKRRKLCSTFFGHRLNCSDVRNASALQLFLWFGGKTAWQMCA